MKKLCTDIGELRRTTEFLDNECPITPITVEYITVKQKGVFSHGYIKIETGD